MSRSWQKQSPGNPLFADMLWSRPENKLHAGKLLIVGGNLHGFAAVGKAFAVTSSSAGQVQIILPDKLKKTVGKLFPEANFMPSTHSGSFAKMSMAEILSLADWSDGVLLAGDFGRNSETAIVIEQLSRKYTGPLVVAQDAIDYFYNMPELLLKRPQTTIVGSFAQIQKLAINARYPKPLKYEMGLIQICDWLIEFSNIYACGIMTKHLDNLYVANQGNISVTNLDEDLKIWRVNTAAEVAVWQIQNPLKEFEALTCAAYQIANKK